MDGTNHRLSKSALRRLRRKRNGDAAIVKAKKETSDILGEMSMMYLNTSRNVVMFRDTHRYFGETIPQLLRELDDDGLSKELCDSLEPLQECFRGILVAFGRINSLKQEACDIADAPLSAPTGGTEEGRRDIIRGLFDDACKVKLNLNSELIPIFDADSQRLREIVNEAKNEIEIIKLANKLVHRFRLSEKWQRVGYEGDVDLAWNCGYFGPQWCMCDTVYCSLCHSAIATKKVNNFLVPIPIGDNDDLFPFLKKHAGECKKLQRRLNRKK
jgi:hypothetical protein